MSVSRQMGTKKTKQIEVDKIIIDSYFIKTIFLYEMKKNFFFKYKTPVDYWHFSHLLTGVSGQHQHRLLEFMQLRFPLKTNLSRRNVLSGR